MYQTHQPNLKQNKKIYHYLFSEYAFLIVHIHEVLPNISLPPLNSYHHKLLECVTQNQVRIELPTFLSQSSITFLNTTPKENYNAKQETRLLSFSSRFTFSFESKILLLLLFFFFHNKNYN